MKKKYLILTIVSGAAFIGYSFNLQDAFQQNNPILVLVGYAIVGCGFLTSLITFIKCL